MQEIAAGVFSYPPMQKEEKLILDWFSFIDVQNENSRRSYQRAIIHFNRWRARNSILNPTRDDVIRWRNELARDHRPSTVNLYLTGVKLWFRFLEQQGIYPNVADHLKGEKIEDGHLKDGLSLEQIRELIGSIGTRTETQKRDLAIILLMVSTGLRTMSVASADIQDLEGFEKWKTDRQTPVKLYYRSKGKKGKGIFVKVDPVVCEALSRYLETRPEYRKEEPLFTGASRRIRGERLRSDSISRMIKTKLRKIGIDSERISAHSLRHSTAQIALENGASLRDVQSLLNHKSVTTTEVYLTDIDRAKSKTESRIISAIFKEDE